MTALGGYVIGTKGQVCVVPKLSRVTSYVQNPAPQGEKVPIDRTITILGSLDAAHHRARAVTDACIRRASTPPFSSQTFLILVEALTRVLVPKPYKTRRMETVAYPM